MNSLRSLALASVLLASSFELFAGSNSSDALPSAYGIPAIEVTPALEKLNAQVESRLQTTLAVAVQEMRAGLPDSVQVAAAPATQFTPRFRGKGMAMRHLRGI
jgi:hypothetical protein